MSKLHNKLTLEIHSRANLKNLWQTIAVQRCNELLKRQSSHVGSCHCCCHGVLKSHSEWQARGERGMLSQSKTTSSNKEVTGALCTAFALTQRSNSVNRVLIIVFLIPGKTSVKTFNSGFVDLLQK